MKKQIALGLLTVIFLSSPVAAFDWISLIPIAKTFIGNFEGRKNKEQAEKALKEALKGRYATNYTAVNQNLKFLGQWKAVSARASTLHIVIDRSLHFERLARVGLTTDRFLLMRTLTAEKAKAIAKECAGLKEDVSEATGDIPVFQELQFINIATRLKSNCEEFSQYRSDLSSLEAVTVATALNSLPEDLRREVASTGLGQSDDVQLNEARLLAFESAIAGQAPTTLYWETASVREPGWNAWNLSGIEPTSDTRNFGEAVVENAAARTAVDALGDAHTLYLRSLLRRIQEDTIALQNAWHIYIERLFDDLRKAEEDFLKYIDRSTEISSLATRAHPTKSWTDLAKESLKKIEETQASPQPASN